MESNKKREKTEHFFGSIMYVEENTSWMQPDRWILVDGQQRITTAMLFLMAIRDLANNKKIAISIDAKYLVNGETRAEGEYKSKLKQVEGDYGAYKHLILRQPLDKREKNSIVSCNYKFFCSTLEEYKNNGGDLEELIEMGLGMFSVVAIQLQPDTHPWENPQKIFETMNSLGKPLSLADLVRNHLLMGLSSDDQTRLYEKYWIHIEKTLTGQISNYIRDYMQIAMRAPVKQATEANDKELYRTFTNQFAGVPLENLLCDLSEYSDYYAYLLP